MKTEHVHIIKKNGSYPGHLLEDIKHIVKGYEKWQSDPSKKWLLAYGSLRGVPMGTLVGCLRRSIKTSFGPETAPLGNRRYSFSQEYINWDLRSLIEAPGTGLEVLSVTDKRGLHRGLLVRTLTLGDGSSV